MPVIVLAVVLAFIAPLKLDQRGTPRPPATKIATDVICPADLGRGVKSRRPFCDVTVTTDPAKGIVLRIPPHTGPSILRFDLHNRFNVGGDTLPFSHAGAVVAALNGNSGALIERAAVLTELRLETDLFDRLAGPTPGTTKSIAPGRAESAVIEVPASVTSVSVVGVRVEITTRAGREVFATPGRPVAMVSNMRVEYTPAVVGK
jgi:hypothetical protein